LNGLRISEALGADIENLEQNRGHRTLFIHRVYPSQKVTRLPPSHSPREPRGQSISTSTNARQARSSSTATALTVSTVTPQPGSCGASRSERGSTSGSRPTRYATASSPQPSTQASRFVTSRRLPRLPTRGPRCDTTEAADRSTGTPPTSSQPSLQVPAAERYECRRPHLGRRPYRSLCRLWVRHGRCCSSVQSRTTTGPLRGSHGIDADLDVADPTRHT
jgi:hypothetical protein